MIEPVLELELDQAALLLDDQQLLEPARKTERAFGLERPAQAHLVEREAEIRRAPLVEPEQVERLAHIEIGLAGGDDADAPARAVEHHAVEAIGARERQRGRQLVIVQPPLLIVRRVGPANIDAALGQRVIARQCDRHARGIERHDGRGIDRLGDADHADPKAGIARERKAELAEVQQLLHARRVDHRHGRRHEIELALMRQRR